MTTLLEDPMPVIFFGIVAEAILGVVLLQTRRGAVLIAMVAVLVVVLGCVGLERLVVTDTEQVENTLFLLIVCPEDQVLTGREGG